jgi:hypothetical protein
MATGRSSVKRWGRSMLVVQNKERLRSRRLASWMLVPVTPDGSKSAVACSRIARRRTSPSVTPNEGNSIRIRISMFGPPHASKQGIVLGEANLLPLGSVNLLVLFLLRRVQDDVVV